MNKFIILGCHRTGLTLLRLIMNSHPSVHCFDETLGYNAYSDNDKPPRIRTVYGFKIPNYTELFFEYEGIHDMYKGEPILFMVRDPKDTVASMKTCENGKFIEGVSTSMKDWFFDRNRNIFKEMRHQLVWAECSNYPKTALAALYWRYKTDALLRFIKEGYRVLPVVYENLVREPELQVKRITKFLGLSWSDQMLTHHKLSHDESNHDGETTGGNRIDRPIDTKSIGYWKDSLNYSEYEIISHLTDDTYRQVLSPLLR